MELESQRIWDYARDCYVHKTHGNTGYTPGEQDPSFNSEADPNGGKQTLNESQEKRIKEQRMNADNLLMAALESQESFFVGKIGKLEHSRENKIKTIEKHVAIVIQEKEDIERELHRVAKQKEELDLKKQKLQEQIEQFTLLQRQLQQEHSEREKQTKVFQQQVEQAEQAINDTSKDTRIEELEEQVRDLLFFIEAQKKMTDEQSLENGQVIKIKDSTITPPNSTKSTPKRGRGRGKGRR